MQDSGHIPTWPGERVESTNARGRHRYQAAFKAWIVEQARQPGMSLAGLAMRNQINAKQLRRWVVVLSRPRSAEPSPLMLPVTLAAAPPPTAVATSPRACIELSIAEVTVWVHAGADTQTLRDVLEALRGGPR
ncbi:transposase [uncultured Pseudacidovorax sp.]|uniref:transposase n=1 Tax=uncultured Pseudacidovorax sp. TaxID=679313 RepID=UPI0025F8C22F|nr:transposase [uncultured Pseudacidovorax sp.]